MTVETNIIYTDKDLGKNLYRQKRYYTLVVEQEVLANNQEEADNKFVEHGGISHSMINAEITNENEGVQTYMIDANYSDSGKTEYMGKIVYEDDEFAKEDGLVEIDKYIDENALTDRDKEESDIDVAITLEAENERGK
jgi:hypothetical protein